MTSRSEQDGFTLVEVLVVITIIGLMTALAFSRGTPVSPSVHARSSARAMADALRETRSLAIAGNRSASFTLDIGNARFLFGESQAEDLPKDLRLSLFTSQDQLVTERIGRIRFDPDGGSTGGRIAIEGGGEVWMVGVDWLSGHVSVETRKP